MSKKPLFPHRPKRREPLHPHTPRSKIETLPAISSGSDIWFRGNYLGSVPTKELQDEIREALKELKNTVAHKRRIILGYRLTNIDSLAKEKVISEAERKAAHRILERAEEILSAPKTWHPAVVSTEPSLVSQTEDIPHGNVTITCPICGKVIEVPEYNRVTRTEALKKHIEKEHPVSRLPFTEGGEPLSPEYRHLANLVSEPLPRDAY